MDEYLSTVSSTILNLCLTKEEDKLIDLIRSGVVTKEVIQQLNDGGTIMIACELRLHRFLVQLLQSEQLAPLLLPVVIGKMVTFEEIEPMAFISNQPVVTSIMSNGTLFQSATDGLKAALISFAPTTIGWNDTVLSYYVTKFTVDQFFQVWMNRGEDEQFKRSCTSRMIHLYGTSEVAEKMDLLIATGMVDTTYTDELVTGIFHNIGEYPSSSITKFIKEHGSEAIKKRLLLNHRYLNRQVKSGMEPKVLADQVMELLVSDPEITLSRQMVEWLISNNRVVSNEHLQLLYSRYHVTRIHEFDRLPRNRAVENKMYHLMLRQGYAGSDITNVVNQCLLQEIQLVDRLHQEGKNQQIVNRLTLLFGLRPVEGHCRMVMDYKLADGRTVNDFLAIEMIGTIDSVVAKRIGLTPMMVEYKDDSGHHLPFILASNKIRVKSIGTLNRILDLPWPEPYLMERDSDGVMVPIHLIKNFRPTPWGATETVTHQVAKIFALLKKGDVMFTDAEISIMIANMDKCGDILFQLELISRVIGPDKIQEIITSHVVNHVTYPDVLIKYLYDNIPELDEGDLCHICYAHGNRIKLGCNHKLCFYCSNKLKKCPYCRHVDEVGDRSIVRSDIDTL